MCAAAIVVGRATSQGPTNDIMPELSTCGRLCRSLKQALNRIVGMYTTLHYMYTQGHRNTCGPSPVSVQQSPSTVLVGTTPMKNKTELSRHEISGHFLVALLERARPEISLSENPQGRDSLTTFPSVPYKDFGALCRSTDIVHDFRPVIDLQGLSTLGPARHFPQYLYLFCTLHTYSQMRYIRPRPCNLS